MTALSVTALAVDYGTAQVFHDVSLRVEAGRAVTLLGNNGAGKTTLLRSLSGVLKPQGGRARRGRAEFGRANLLGLHADAIVRAGVVHVPEGRRVFEQLTVEDNLTAGALSVSSRRRTAVARGRVHELFPILKERSRQRAGLLSGGEQQMLAIGRALMSNPKLLLMDEPSLGLAPLVARQIMATIQDITADGTGVLLVEQNTKLALDVVDHGYVIDAGSIVAEGTPQELRAGDLLLEVSLGRRAAHDRAAAQLTDGAP